MSQQQQQQQQGEGTWRAIDRIEFLRMSVLTGLIVRLRLSAFAGRICRCLGADIYLVLFRT